MQTEALVKTTSSDLYLKKLCRHFAHRIPATMGERRGILEFPFGRCRLEAEAEQLRLVIDLEEGAEAIDAERVLGDHLRRMARHEALQVQWNRSIS